MGGEVVHFVKLLRVALLTSCGGSCSLEEGTRGAGRGLDFELDFVTFNLFAVLA